MVFSRGFFVAGDKVPGSGRAWAVRLGVPGYCRGEGRGEKWRVGWMWKALCGEAAGEGEWEVKVGMDMWPTVAAAARERVIVICCYRVRGRPGLCGAC